MGLTCIPLPEGALPWLAFGGGLPPVMVGFKGKIMKKWRIIMINMVGMINPNLT